MQVNISERIPIKIWSDNIDEDVLSQAQNLANLPFAINHVALMPNAHKDYKIPVGTVFAAQEALVPIAIGEDIGCGCMVVKTNLNEIETELLQQIVQEIYEVVPVEHNRQKEPQRWEDIDRAPDIPIVQNELGPARYFLGVLGGKDGHFIEIDQGSDGHVWLMVHSGSHSLGEKVFYQFHKMAVELCKRWHADIPSDDIAFLPVDSPQGRDYFGAMQFCLTFAAENRALIMSRVLDVLNRHTGAKKLSQIDVLHNYVAAERHFGHNVLVHRKGTISARLHQIGVVAGTMGTKSHIVGGLGNVDSFQSCSHGAGRRMEPRQAERELNLAEEQAKMVNILHKPLTTKSLGQAPGAYKDIEAVMEKQRDLVEILVELTPLAIIKG